jgi:hypothetical protein
MGPALTGKAHRKGDKGGEASTQVSARPGVHGPTNPAQYARLDTRAGTNPVTSSATRTTTLSIVGRLLRMRPEGRGQARESSNHGLGLLSFVDPELLL